MKGHPSSQPLGHSPFRWTALACALAVLAVTGTGCSVRKIAVRKIGDAIAAGGSSFASDDDPDLIKAAAPTNLKLMESLLAESPRHAGLLLATASGFTQYAYAFLEQEADELEEKDLTAATALRGRAKRLYLRARDYGLRGLDVAHPDFAKALRADPKRAVAAAKKADVPLLYWTAAAWGSAISLGKDNPDLVADQPIVEALIDRALALDEAWDDGSIHGFLITYETARAGGKGPAEARAREHFARAMDLAKGQQAAPLVALAEAVCIAKQDAKEFKSLLERALAIDVNARPEWRLVNTVMQRRARWLLGRIEDLFLVATPAPGKAE